MSKYARALGVLAFPLIVVGAVVVLGVQATDGPIIPDQVSSPSLPEATQTAKVARPCIDTGI